jgi:Helicase associated domain
MKIQGRTPGDAMPISDENIQKLRDAGFPFEPVERGRRKSVTRVNLDDYDDNRNDELKPPKRSIRSFDERLQDFIEWKKENGTALVPQSLKGLGDWVHTQRRQYAKKLKGEVSSMSDGRISKLLAAGFIFDGNEARKQDALVKQERPLGDAPQQPSLNLETTMVAQQVVALGHSDPNPLGWY